MCNENCAPNWKLTKILLMAVLKFVTISSHVGLKPVTIFIAHGLFHAWGEGVKTDICFGFVTVEVRWVAILSSLLQDKWQLDRKLEMFENNCFAKRRRSILW